MVAPSGLSRSGRRHEPRHPNLQRRAAMAKPWLPPAPCERHRANPETAMYSFISLISTIIQIYIYILIASAVLSWLIAFNVVNMRNQFIATIAEALWRLTEPALRPIRRVLPSFGGLDLSPVVLILLLIFVQNLLYEYFVPRAL
jgi:YggT family protein